MAVEIARRPAGEEAAEDRLEPVEVAPVHDLVPVYALELRLAFGDELVRQAEGLGHGMPARRHRIEALKTPACSWSSWKSGWVTVLLRIALPRPGGGELAEAVALHLEDEEPVEWVEDEKSPSRRTPWLSV